MGRLLLPGDQKPEKKGLRLLNENELSSFHDVEKIDPERIPTPFAKAYDFARRLEGKEPDEAEKTQKDSIRDRKEDAVKTLEYLVKGIFYGIIDTSEKIEWSELGILGNILKSSVPGLNNFGILRWHSQNIGSFYPETLGFYKPGFDDTNLRGEIDSFEVREPQSVKVFKKWILDESSRLRNNLPLWLKELYAHYNSEESTLASTNVDNYTYAIQFSGINFRVYIPGISVPTRVPECPICEQRIFDFDAEVDLEWDKGFYISCPNKDGGRININDFEGVFCREKSGFVIWKDVPLPPLCNKVEYGVIAANKAAFTFGRVRILVKGEIINPDDIKCEKIYRFKTKDSNIYRIPNYPIKSEYLDYIEIEGDPKPIKIEKLNDTYSWDIKLKGVTNPKSYRFDIEGKEKDYSCSVWLWPDFKKDGWNVNLLYSNCDPVFSYDKNTQITLRFFYPRTIDDKPIFTLGSGHHDESNNIDRGWVDGDIEFIEVMIGQKPCGIYRDIRTKVELSKDAKSGTILDILSFDFGTSNTALAYGITADGESEILRFNDHSTDLFGLDYNKMKIAPGSLFLPTFGLKKHVPYIPSELIFAEKNIKKAGGQLVTEVEEIENMHIERYVQDFTVTSHLINVGEREQLLVLMNFKWDVPPKMSRENVIFIYLKMLFLLSLAELKDKSVITDLILSYPAAYDFHRFSDFNKAMVRIKEFLSDNLGVTVNDIKYITEGEAVACLSGLRQNGSDNYLVLDLGGGTLDITLVKPDNSLSIVDSIRYAGGCLLEWLGDKKFYPLDSPASNQKNSARLGQYLRRGKDGIRTVFFRPDGRGDEKRQALLGLFFEGALHMVRKLVKWHKNGNLRICLAGNGWYLIHGIRGSRQKPGEYIKKRLTSNSTIFNEDTLGTITISNEITYLDNPKHVVSQGAIKGKDLAKDYDEIQNDTALPIRTIVGLDVEYDGSKIEWDKHIPRHVKKGKVGVDGINTQITESLAQLSSGTENEIGSFGQIVDEHIKGRECRPGLCPEYSSCKTKKFSDHLEKGIYGLYLEEFYRKKIGEAK